MYGDSISNSTEETNSIFFLICCYQHVMQNYEIQLLLSSFPCWWSYGWKLVHLSCGA